MIEIDHIIHTRTGLTPPRWVLRLLRRLLHEEEINRLISSGEGLEPQPFLRHIFRELGVEGRIRCNGRLSPERRYIFVANHPFGALDGMLLADMLLSRWADVGVVVNDMLMYIEPLRPLWIPVNKFGRQSALCSRRYDEAMASPKKQVLTFPAGLCSRWVGGAGGRIEDLEWRHHFVRDAERYHRHIVPIRVEGRLSPRFYAISRLRQWLGIGANIELLLLVDELFRQRGLSVEITLGHPIDPTLLAGTAAEKSTAIRQRLYSLG